MRNEERYNYYSNICNNCDFDVEAKTLAQFEANENVGCCYSYHKVLIYKVRTFESYKDGGFEYACVKYSKKLNDFVEL